MPSPAHDQMRFDDLPRYADDHNRYELLDGELLVSPCPSTRHASVATAITGVFLTWTHEHAPGTVFGSPVDVFLDDTRKNVLEPDVTYVAAARSSIIKHRGIVGAPDLVVEILSPGTAKRDRGVKRHAYARFGVPEYWIVDPIACEVIVHTLRGRWYAEWVRASGEEVVRSKVLAGLEFPASKLFASMKNRPRR